MVASEAERKALRALQRRSLAMGADEALQCEVGKEITANSSLKASVTGGRRKRLHLQLLSAEKGCLVEATNATWSADQPLVSVGQAVGALVSRLRLPSTQLPWSTGSVVPPRPANGSNGDGLGQSRVLDTSDYDAILARARDAEAEAQRARESAERLARERAERLEKAWTAVDKAATTKALLTGDRLAILAKFLSDFPDDNPHAEAAQRYQALLRAGREPNAAPTDMVEVLAGEFFMGCNERVDAECDGDEKPGKRVNLPTFYIDRTEVTVDAYAECVRAGRCTDYHLTGYEWPGQSYTKSPCESRAGSPPRAER